MRCLIGRVGLMRCLIGRVGRVGQRRRHQVSAKEVHPACRASRGPRQGSVLPSPGVKARSAEDPGFPAFYLYDTTPTGCRSLRRSPLQAPHLADETARGGLGGENVLSLSSKKTFAKWSFAEKAVLFRQGLCRMPQMQGTESEGEGSVLTHMTKPESRK